jgi:CheY-like chemotaxis protein
MPTRVLVVDDNPDSVIIIRGMLEPRGYVVTTASSGAEALEITRRELPDVILLDVMMPEMSGLEVLEQLKEDYSTGKIPVILVTAKTQDDDVMKGYQFGADYYIPKPFTAKQLLYGVELVLGKSDPGA